MIALIGRRARYVEAAARFKTGEQSVRAPERQRKMLAERRRWAEENGLDQDVIEALYRNHVSYFVAREMHQWRETCEQNFCALSGNILNNGRRRAWCRVTSGFSPVILTLVPERLGRGVTWITNFL